MFSQVCNFTCYCSHSLSHIWKADSGPCCPPDISVGFNWPTAPIGITIQQKCNNIHSNFQPFSSARRTCLSSGVWGPVDISGCTVLSSNSATTAAVVVANVTASRVKVGANSSVLVNQVSVQFNASVMCIEYNVYILDHNHKNLSLFPFVEEQLTCTDEISHWNRMHSIQVTQYVSTRMLDLDSEMRAQTTYHV